MERNASKAEYYYRKGCVEQKRYGCCREAKELFMDKRGDHADPEKVKFYESVDPESERINYVYFYEASDHALRRCRETWRDDVAQARSPLDLLLERIRIRVHSQLIYPLMNRRSASRASS